MGNDLDGRAQIVAAALAREHIPVDLPGAEAVGPARRHAGEALVVAEVEIGLRPVVGHIDFAVLIRAHRARIDVEIGIELAQADGIAAGLQQRAERRRGQTLAERRCHPAGNENEARHAHDGTASYRVRRIRESGRAGRRDT